MTVAVEALAREILNCIEVSIPFLDLEPVSDSEIDYGETANRIIAIIEREKASAVEGQWQDMATLPNDDTFVLAACKDGRKMVWVARRLQTAMAIGTPKHLSLPADYWMPIRALPLDGGGDA